MTESEITEALNEATRLRSEGNLEGALEGYQEILRDDSDNLQAHCSAGEILAEMGRKAEAVVHYQEGLRIAPQIGPLYNNLALALRATGKHVEAMEAMKQAVILMPENVGIRVNFGNWLQEAGLLDEARKEYQQAIKLNPGMTRAHCGLGSTWTKLGNPEEAEKCFREALQLNPDHANALTNLGVALRDQSRPEEALSLGQRAVELDPQSASHRHSLAFTLQYMHRWDEAVAEWQRAVELKPDHAEAHLGIATTDLIHGRFRQGWIEYEWRWRCRGAVVPVLLKQYQNLLWDGSSLEGKTILLYAEQGLGDAIQFVRWVSTLANKAKRVVLACHHRRLAELFATVEGISEIIGLGQNLPQFDVHCPIMSLPRLLAIDDCGKIPAQVPYLHPKPELVELLRGELGEKDHGTFRVGINWQGNVKHPHDSERSIPLQAWNVLKEVPGIQWFSLQYGATAETLNADGVELRIEDLGGRVADLAKGQEIQSNMNLTAAALMNLDLVITVDSMLAHLAGALGRPTWVLLSHLPDWRWMLERSDSPWYPSLRLLRQQTVGNWDGVLEQVRLALGELTSAGKSPSTGA